MFLKNISMKRNDFHFIDVKAFSLTLVFLMVLVVTGCASKGKKSGKNQNAEKADVDSFLKLAKVAANADCIYDFSEGLAAFKKGDKIGVVNKNGDIVLQPTVYDGGMCIAGKGVGDFNPLLFIEGMALVRKGGYYDENNNLVKPWKYGYIDKNGKEIIPCTFDGAESFSEGYAVVYKDGKGGVIDKSGKQVVPYKYDMISDFSEGFAKIETDDGLIGFINTKGEEVVPIKYRSWGSTNFSEGFAAVGVDYGDYVKYGYIDKTGKVVIEPVYDLAGMFHDGRACVMKDGMYGYIDTKGHEVIPLIYDFVGSDMIGKEFDDGVAVVYKDEHYQIIDKHGKAITEPKFTSFVGTSTSEGLFYLSVNASENGLIDKYGKEIVPLKYHYGDIRECKEGFVGIKKNDKWGFVDKTGKQVIPCIYDDVRYFSDGYVVVKMNGVYGYLTKEGKSTFDIDDSDLKSIIANKKREIDEKKHANELEKERKRKEQASRSVDNQVGGNVNSILYECKTEITAIQREIEYTTRVFVSLASQDVDMYKYTQMKSTYINGVDNLVKKADRAFDNYANKLRDAGITDADAKIKEEKRNFHSAIYELRTKATQQTDMSY